MCLEINNEATEKFRKKNKNKREVVVWKLYRIDDYDGDFYPPLCPYPYRSIPIKAGWVKSNRKSVHSDLEDFKDGEYDQVVRGIHVYLTREDARRSSRRSWATRDKKVVRCTALVSDFVAAGGYNGIDDDQAVFMKIRILKADLEKGKKSKA